MTGKPRTPRAQPVVLLVDDEPALLESLAQELREAFQLYTASSAAEAEVMLAARTYDAIVSDHLMPGEQGLDFLVRVSQVMPSTKRIMVTGYANPELISRSVGLAGLSACLIKPVRAAEIIATVRKALEA
jgi:DNA-binding NtrC family response regulator